MSTPGATRSVPVFEKRATRGADLGDVIGRRRRRDVDRERGPLRFVAGGRDQQHVAVEHGSGQVVEQADGFTVLLERLRRCGRQGYLLFQVQLLHHPGKVDSERHRNDVGAFRRGPVDRLDQHEVGIAAAAHHLADDQALDSGGDADARQWADGATGDGSGAVGAVAVPVADVARRAFGEVAHDDALLCQQRDKGFVRQVDAGVEHGDPDAAPGPHRTQRPHGL